MVAFAIPLSTRMAIASAKDPELPERNAGYLEASLQPGLKFT